MRIIDATLVEHRGALAHRVANSRRDWSERAALQLRLTDDAGHVGIGEASPLPGYSSDSLQECHRALRHLDYDAPPPPLPPAAQFALDTALLDLRSRRQARPAWSLLTRQPPASIPLAVVLHESDPGALRDELRRAIAAGFRAFKLKIGGYPNSDLARAQLVRQEAPRAELRLDANRAFRRDEVVQRLTPYRELDCAFVEEPCWDCDLGANSEELPALIEVLPVPLALDESLHPPHRETALAQLLGRAPVAALVVKPMALGGIARLRRFAEAAQPHHVPLILSHLFDGPRALAACGALALAFGSPEVPAGLAPHAGLTAWPPTPLPMFTAATLTPWTTPGLIP